MHEAATNQLIAVLEGAGEVSGGEGVARQVGAGDAIFISRAEQHETRTAEGMTALIIEGESVSPPDDSAWQTPRRDGDRPAVGVGCILRDGEGRILLMKRRSAHGGGTWSTPGGFLEHGESWEACGARETREETGAVAGELTFFGVTNDFFPESGRHFVTVWVSGTFEGGDIEPSDEVEELGWFHPGAFPEPLFLSLQNLIAAKGLP